MLPITGSDESLYLRAVFLNRGGTLDTLPSLTVWHIKALISKDSRGCPIGPNTSRWRNLLLDPYKALITSRSLRRFMDIARTCSPFRLHG